MNLNFLLVGCMFIPAILCVIGVFFLKRAPRKINRWYGYRTARSMKNYATWEFANKHCAKTLLKVGIVMLIVVSVAIFKLVECDEKTIELWATAIPLVEAVSVIFCVIPTEYALKQEFDDDGNRRN